MFRCKNPLTPLILFQGERGFPWSENVSSILLYVMALGFLKWTHFPALFSRLPTVAEIWATKEKDTFSIGNKQSRTRSRTRNVILEEEKKFKSYDNLET